MADRIVCLLRIPSASPSRLLRHVAPVALAAALAACASHAPRISATQEAAQYVAHARNDYQPPGPPDDPWGPFIAEAAARYDVPPLWIRQVMHQESGGNLYLDGRLITSSAGAMGLMQVMPETYDELRQRYGLGNDPFDPHDNIMAGTAYLRELYDLYGSPGFLAAYNAGPHRLDDYLTRNRPLPAETRHYVANIAPYIAGASPQRLSPATNVAMLQIPADIPPGPRYPRRQQAPTALAAGVRQRSGWSPGEVQVAALVPPPPPPPPPVPTTFATAPVHAKHGFSLIPHAYADVLPVHATSGGSGGWAIQVGAFNSAAMARSAAVAARVRAHDLLAAGQPTVGSVKTARGAVLYRARLVGLSRDSALGACQRLGHCIVVSPDAI
jgi:hypothetical protein